VAGKFRFTLLLILHLEEANGLDVVRLACAAMATRWEILLYGDGEGFLRSVAEEALDEVRRLESQLSLFVPTSETSDVNRRAAAGPVVVDPRFFRLLRFAVSLSEETDGAFDITVAPLMRAWRFEGDTGALPSDEAILEALNSVGYQHILLDDNNTTVQFDMPGLQIDLGAIGKGYAIDCAVEIVRDHGISSGILHAGTSTAFGMGCPPDTEGWLVAVRLPDGEGAKENTEFLLNDGALSVSAPHGKYFEKDGVQYGHVIDPRTGRAVSANLLAAVATQSAAESDALSTALLTNGPEWLSELSRLRPEVSAYAAVRRDGQVYAKRLISEYDSVRPINPDYS